MKRFFVITKWQLQLLVKYNIITVAVVIALLYVFLLRIFPSIRIDLVVIPLIFSDPSMYGFIFIGAIILFEKSDNTLPALVVTPMRQWEFLWAKAVALLIPALIAGFAIAIAAWGFDFKFLPLLIAISLSSVLFTFIGFFGVSKVKTFNQYMIIIPLFLAPTAVPLINYFELVNWPVLYIIPTQSALDIFSYTRTGTNYLAFILNVLYLLVWISGSYFMAARAYNKTLMA